MTDFLLILIRSLSLSIGVIRVSMLIFAANFQMYVQQKDQDKRPVGK